MCRPALKKWGCDKELAADFVYIPGLTLLLILML
jgi:hypothetical protein